MSKLGGLIRQFAMALMFGTSAANDAWLIASVIPNLFFGSVSGAITVTTVPILSEADAQYSQESTNVFISQALVAIGIITLVLNIVAEIFAPLITRLVAPGFRGNELQLAITMARIVMPTLWIQALAGFFSGILQQREQYSAPAAIPVLINIVRILGIVVLGRFMGIIGVAVGFTVGTALQFTLLIGPLRRAKIRLRPTRHLNHPLLKKMGRISVPYFVNSSVNSVEIIVDRVLSSYLVTGSIAAINYSYTLVQVPLTLLLAPITTPLLTRLSQQYSDDDLDEFRHTAFRGMELTLFILAPVTMWFITLRIPILVVLFQHGAFTIRSTQLTATTLLAFSLGIPGFGMVFYLRNLFFASKDTKVPARYGIIAIMCNIAGDLVLVHVWQAAGLSLSTSIANWVNATLMMMHLSKTNVLKYSQFKKTLSPILLASMGMLATWAIVRLAISPLHLRLLGELSWAAVNLVLSGIVYVFILRRYNNEMLDWLETLIKKRLVSWNR
ncbi:MAG: murein biosynthesis integral membrane protein MurJ [Firmicutes bacterium]|nr:murein biosynthesis integral membrane protein MurJ [Bacillota bacterium]